MIRNAIRMAMLALALLCALPSGADYEAGQQAWDSGRPDEALAQWRTAADAGDRRAMLALGRLYAQGLGAPQDYLEAHKWFNLAASRGEMAAVEERDALAAKMTPQQVQAAQALARSWQPGGGGTVAIAGAAGTGSTGATAAARAAASDAGAPPPRAIREAQGLLAELGYAPGPADGVWGQRTALAYLLFLEAEGLPAPAERLTPEALRAMRAAAKRAGVASGGAATAARAASGTPQESSGVNAPRAPAGLPPDALHRAAQAGDIVGLQAALSAGAAVDALDGRGWTALMYAVNKGYTLLVEPLLGVGADPDVRAPDGATALFMAAVHGHSEIIAQLLDADADASIPGPKGTTPLEVAQMQGNPKAVGTLHEIHVRKEREETARKVREAHGEAVSRAKSLNTLQAYEDYLSSYCPQGSFCGAASTRRDELLREAISGSIFRGSLDDDFYARLTLQFIPSDELAGYYDAKGWGYGKTKFFGTWNVKGGEVRMSVKGGFGSRALGMATLSSDVLAGYFDWARKKRVWRLDKIKDVEEILKPNASSPHQDDSRDGN